MDNFELFVFLNKRWRWRAGGKNSRNVAFLLLTKRCTNERRIDTIVYKHEYQNGESRVSCSSTGRRGTKRDCERRLEFPQIKQIHKFPIEKIK